MLRNRTSGGVFLSGRGFQGPLLFTARRWVENPHRSVPINGLQNATFWCRECLRGVGTAGGGTTTTTTEPLPAAHRLFSFD